MKENLNEYACKEVWYILKKLPINIISKIPFEIRTTIAEKSHNCNKNIGEINTSVNLKEMNITNEAKDILSWLYVDYLSDDSIKSTLKEYINFCDKKINQD